MKTVNELLSTARTNGFKDYSDMAHPDKVEYPNINIASLTCTKGRFKGEVVDIWYNFTTGEVVHTSIFSQFKETKANFKFN